MNGKKIILNLVLSLILILAVFYFIHPEETINSLSKADIHLFLLAVVAYFGVNTSMTLRIKTVLEESGHQLRILDIIKCHFAGMLASDFTPARGGYFLTAFSLTSKYKVPLEKTMLSIFGPQLLDFLIKAISASILSILVLSQISGFQDQMVMLWGIVGVVILVVGFFIMLLFSPKLLEKFSFIKKIGVGRKLFYLFHLMQKNSHTLLKRKYEVIGYTFFAWMAKATEWYLIQKSLGITIFDPFWDFWFCFIFQPAITIIQFIPLPTVAGSGASEAVFTGILYLLGVPLELGLAFALLTRGIMMLVDMLGIPAIIGFLRKENIGELMADIENMENRAGM